ncbi:MAG TPA: beta-ketoacyl-ACP synthase III [Vicinamibacterales bacterium]|jgi:3-oxoacyl-[acyl-carrier-protein] synthase-3|nr:beta-ketoacyl-ACP synthase III [Vicinamibacterales bacterium]
MPKATISAITHYVPPQRRPNAFYAGHLDTTDEWIQSRTGIRERRIAPTGGTSDLIVRAAERCLAARRTSALDIDCIIVATITPDHVFPSTASTVQHRIGASRAWGFDLSAACSGFVYGLIIASKMVESGAARRVLLCAGDKMSSITNWDDRHTAVLFGDAGSAAIIEQSDDPALGISDFVTWMDGAAGPFLQMPAGGSARPATFETVSRREHTLVQDGKAVFKAAVAGMTRVTTELLTRNGLTPDDIAWFVPHQANARIIEAVSGRLGVDPRKVMVNIDRLGNTCAATIPTCLSEWHNSADIEIGQQVVIATFGAGFTAGAALVRWSSTYRTSACARESTDDAHEETDIAATSWRPEPVLMV